MAQETLRSRAPKASRPRLAWRYGAPYPSSHPWHPGIFEATASCHCLTADYTRGIVQPGDTGHVTLTYDGRGTEGYFNKKARVRFNSPRIHELYVKGEIISGQDKD